MLHTNAQAELELASEALLTRLAKNLSHPQARIDKRKHAEYHKLVCCNASACDKKARIAKARRINEKRLIKDSLDFDAECA